MGIGLFGKCPTAYAATRKVVPNPNPRNFEVLRTFAVNQHLVVMLRYPDCTNYEGKKVLVMDNCQLHEFMRRKQVDPHFRDGGGPAARFRPTEVGWRQAIAFAATLP